MIGRQRERGVGHWSLVLLAQPNIDIDAEDDHGLTITALQHATELIQLEIMKILLKNGARDEGILDIAVDNIKSGRLIQFKRIFQFLVKEVGLAVTQQIVDKVTEPGRRLLLRRLQVRTAEKKCGK